MKFVFNWIVFSGILIIPYILSATHWVKTYSTAPFIGPEIYYMTRTKEGGSKQTGTLYGVRLGYDHVQRYKIYGGIDVLWAQGTLEGHVEDDKLKSEFTDFNGEARLGYTFQCKFWRCLSFTPYLGVGYFCEKNNYQHPSPLKIHFRNSFSYVPIGFLSQVFLNRNLSIGVNFKVRVIIEGEQHVSHDPSNDSHTQKYEEKLQYRAELPVTYFFCWKCHSLSISLVPFFEYRQYGHRANFPFDFLEVKFKLYGSTLKLSYLF